MSADFDSKNTLTNKKFNVESEAEQAKAKTEIILFDTDLINFTDEDFICGEAKINESCENGAEDTDEEEANEDECCSDCPYFCPVCGECMYEDECDE